MGSSGTLFAQNISKIMIGDKTYKYLAIIFSLFILSIPHLTFAAVCNMVDGVIYGYGYDTGGAITNYGISDSSCEGAGPGDDICDTNTPGSGGGGCTAVAAAAGSPPYITIGVQNQGSVPDRYQISWTTPPGWSIVMQERILNDGSVTGYSIEVLGDGIGDDDEVCEAGEVCVVEYPNEIIGDTIGNDDGFCEPEEACGLTSVTVPTTTPGSPSSYNAGETPFFTFKVLPPSGFSGPDEVITVIFDILSLNSGYADSVKAVIGSPDVISPALVVLRTDSITETSVRVEWEAPDVTTTFFDDFSDGTLSPWSQLLNGTIEVVDSGEIIDGKSNYVLRKTTNGDPDGGSAPLSQTVTDFELILYTKRLSITCCNADRYSITDASGNGYGLYLDFNVGELYIERRDAWTSTVLGTGSPVSGGLILDQWYTLRFTRIGMTLTAQAYVGRVDPATANPAATVSTSDSTPVSSMSFTQVNVNGGYDYDTDDIQVTAFSNIASSYDLRYSTSRITTEGEFANAAKVDSCQSGESNLGRPRSPGSSELCTVSQLFAGTDYYFALKTSDAVGNYFISICPDDLLPCHARTLTSSGDLLTPGKIKDLSVTESTEDTISLCWTAPAEDVVVAFLDDFSDGTLSPWSLLQNGVVEVVDDGGNYVLRKTTNGDPNGGSAPLSQTVADFELILYTKRLSITCCNADRYSITDASGNGYGLYLDFNDGTLYIERRDAWTATALGTGLPVSGGLTLNQWYTLRFTKTGQSLTARAYVGRVEPATATPAATVSTSDNTTVSSMSFTQVNVNGGYDYDTDDIQVTALGNPATEYILKYSTKYIVDEGVTPGVGEVTFSDATRVASLPPPESPGVKECHIVPVKNIIDTSGILPPGACNLDPNQVGCDDRTRNTRFYFAIKTLDEVRNDSPLSNVTGGITPLLPFAYNMVSVPYVPDPDPNTPPVLNTPKDVFGDNVGTPLYVYWWDSRGPDFDTGCYDGEPDPYSSNPAKYTCVNLASIKEALGYFLWVPSGTIVLDVPVTATQSPTTNCVDEGYGQDTWCTTLGSSFRYYVFPLQEGWNKTGSPFDKEINFTPRDINDNSSIEIAERGLYVRRTSGGAREIATFQDAVTVKNWCLDSTNNPIPCIYGSVYTYNGVNYTYETCSTDNPGKPQGDGCKLVMQPWKAYWIKLNATGEATFELLVPN